MENKKCVACGTEFEPVEPTQIYCSLRCRARQAKRRHRNRKKGEIMPIECSVCGKEFLPSSRKQKKYCSISCSKLAMKAYQREYQRSYKKL